MQNKILLFLFVILLSIGCDIAKSETLDNLQLPKPPAYRVGLSDTPENQYVDLNNTAVKTQKLKPIIDQEKNIADLTYADLSIKNLSKEIAKDIEFDETDMVSDLSLLWQGAATQSDTINFALYKLSNPDADKPNDKSIKKVLTTIASMSTIVGAGMSNPMLATSSILGGNLLGIMGQDTKALNYKYTKVSDADMIILVRKVEDLQQKTVDMYYDYMSAKQQLKLLTDLVNDRQMKFEMVQKNNSPKELVVILDAYYRTALDRQRTAQSEFLVKRAALEQFVGHDTFVQFESELLKRENGESSDTTVENPLTDSQKEDYDNTVKQVENFTGQIQDTSDKDANSANQNETVDINNYKYYEEYTKEDSVTGFAVSVEKKSKNTLAPVPKISESVKKTPQIKTQKTNKIKDNKKDISKNNKDNEVKNNKTSKVKEKPSNKVKNKRIKSTKTINNLENNIDDTSEQLSKTQTQLPKVKKTKNKKEKVKKERVKKEKTHKENKFINFFRDERHPYYDVQAHKTYPKNSTKDLIFVHDDKDYAIKQYNAKKVGIILPDKPRPEKKLFGKKKNIDDLIEQLPEADEGIDSEQPTDTTSNARIKKQKSKDVPIENSNLHNQNNNGLLPLDSIKAPTLTPDGYSIYDDYSGEINSANY